MLLVSCKQKADEKLEVKPISVETMLVESKRFVRPVQGVGFLQRKHNAKLSFKTGGIIAEVKLNEGDVVKASQLLAKLNTEEISATVHSSELALQKAERDFERAKALYEDSVATLELFQNAKTALYVAQNNYKIATFNLKHSSIYAPANGRILKKLAEKGEMIAPGYPVCVFASDEADWVVKINVSDRDILKLSYGDVALLEFDALKGKMLDARLTEIASVADPLTGTFMVELSLNKEQCSRLISGMIAKASVLPAITETAMPLPVSAAITAEGMNAHVFVLTSDGLERREVKLIEFMNDSIFVGAGLSPGEEVVVSNVAFIDEKTKVTKLSSQ